MNRNARSPHEDPLTYLPRRPVQEYSKKRVIYDPQQPSDNLFVVILGRVKITSTTEDGGQILARIVRSDGLFGESCLVGGPNRSESAVALDNVSLMAWTSTEIEAHIEREPRLGIALSQNMVRQCIELQDRIESMAIHQTQQRVMLALLQLADDLGTSTADGSVRLASLPHHTIAEYVGTSREIVTYQMNRLRRLGVLRYSRKFIDIRIETLREALRSEGVAVPEMSNRLDCRPIA
jgi:CRP/FNR family transcriptional regulator, cyclic AMP receptor protein